MSMKPILSLLAASLLFTGCATSTITNLTPSHQMRNSENLYPVEAAFDTREKALQKDTLQPYVIIGFDAYPMEPTPLLDNRWETLIPVPPNANTVNYRYKFDYEYLSVPERRKSSKLSPTYQLQIIDHGP
jgi:hypothetical protein